MSDEPKGVAFSAPGPELVPSITASIRRAVESLPAGSRGAIVGVATQDGVNAAIVARFDHGWDVQAWVGKRWAGPLEAGVQVQKVW